MQCRGSQTFKYLYSTFSEIKRVLSITPSTVSETKRAHPHFAYSVLKLDRGRLS